MIIKQLNIYGYGRWIDQQIDIQNPLQVIYGPNEAGKSTIIAFIKGILFGFPDKKHSPHGQYQPKGNAPYGGEMTFEVDGHLYKIVRTGLKYNGTIKFYDLDQGTELTKDDYQDIISPIDRTAYDQLFYFGSIDQHEFYQMGRDELRMRIQSIGVAGAGDWMSLQSNLDKQSAKMYAPHGRTKTINVQISDYKKLEKQVTDAKADFPHYQHLQADLKTKQASLDQLQSELKILDRHLDEKRHLQTLLPLVSQLKELKGLDESQLKTGFTNDDINQFNQLNLQLKTQEEQVSTRQKAVDEIAGNLVVTPSQKFYEAHKSDVDQLTDELPDAQKLALRIEMVEAQIAEVQKEVDEKASLIDKNDQGELPKPFDEQTFNQVNDLLREQQNLKDRLSENHRRRRQSSSSRNQPNFSIWYGVAIALIIGAVLLSATSASWIGYILAIVSAVWGWYSAKNSTQDAPVETGDDPATVQSQLEKIQDEMTVISKKFQLQGIDESNWISIQSPLQQVTDLKANLQKQSNTLNDSQRKYSDFLRKWTFASDWLKFDQSKYSQTVETIAGTVKHWQQLSASYQQQKDELDKRQKDLESAKADFEQLSLKKKQFLDHRGIQSDTAFNQLVESQDSLVKKLSRKADLEKQITAANVQIPDDLDSEELDAAINDLAVKGQAMRQKLDDLSQETTRIKTEVEGLIKNGKYYDLRQQLANMQTEIVENIQKYMALKLSSQWIQAVLNIASKGRLPKTLTLAKEYFATLTNNAYKDIIFKNEISVVRNDDVHFPINELSTGTLEQLYLALIFSMSVGFSDQYPMPIMIDDGFVNFDKDRKKAAGKLLDQVSERTQVLYFTANLDDNIDSSLVLNLKKL